MTWHTRAADAVSLSAVACVLAAAVMLHCPAARGDAGYRFFESPSHNIACQLGTFSDHGVMRATVGCQISEYDYTIPPRPDNCHGGWGDSVGLTQDQPAALQCHTDTLFGSGSTVLDYGQTAIEEPINCTSSEVAMRCFDSLTGHGFSLSRDSYQLT